MGREGWKYDDGEREIGIRLDMRMYDPTRDFAALLMQQILQHQPPRELSAKEATDYAWDCAERFAERLARYHQKRDTPAAPAGTSMADASV